MISQFFVVSMRGDTILHKECTQSICLLQLHIVRMDLSVGKYTTTQEMFLAKVGITNSYQEDNQNLCQPFFVNIICILTQ